jgi:hypothetical protein
LKKHTDLLVVSLGTFLIASMLGCKKAELRPKNRPAKVPMTAIWVGGADGGAYIECKAGVRANQCTVWNDYTGDVWMNGAFMLQKQNRAATPNELRYSFPDGEKIYLENGLVLSKVGEGTTPSSYSAPSP